MSQKAERIYAAQRAGFLRRLEDSGWRPDLAAELFPKWEAEAERRELTRGGPGFWGDADAWYAERHPPNRRSPRSTL